MIARLRPCAALGAFVLAQSPAHAPACEPGQPIAFTNVRLLTMESPSLRSVDALVTQSGRIVSMGPAVPANACRIDANNGVLMPGLVDMHAHTDERELPLFIANGVTTVREMNGSPTMIALRNAITAGEKQGPNLIVASSLLIGEKIQYRHRLITSREDAFAAAHEAKEAGYEYLKIYDGLSRPMYDAFVEAGRTLGLPLDGHIPQQVGLARVVEAGQSIQHMDKILFALAGNRPDSSKLPELQRLFDGKGIWVTPTLASLRALDASGTIDYTNRLNRPEMNYMDAGTLGWWRSIAGTRPSRPPTARFQFYIAILNTLRETNTKFLLGTDAGNPLMVPGFSVHDELEVLRESGFTPYEALQLATRNVGEFLRDTTIGRVAVGARADLVLVDTNPLDNLSVLRNPRGVMVRGRWLDRAELDAMLLQMSR